MMSKMNIPIQCNYSLQSTQRYKSLCPTMNQNHYPNSSRKSTAPRFLEHFPKNYTISQ